MKHTHRAVLAAASSVFFAAGGIPGGLAQAQTKPEAPASAAAAVEPDHRLDWWKEARFGMFIHFGLYSTLEGKWKDKTSHAEWIRTTAQIPREEYEKLLPTFNPVKFDAKAIARAAKDAGMGYICITTKHHEGFALFDSKVSEWDVMSTPYGKDIMKDLAQACKEEGLKMCWYYSIMDWYHPDYIPRREWEQWSPAGADFERYVAFMKGQLTELLTNYGPIGVLWFDGQWEHNWTDARGDDLYKFVRGLQNDIIINSRVGRAGGNYGLDRASGMLGDYATPEQEIPAGVIRDLPWETCMTMNGHWGFNAVDKDFKPTSDLIRKLADIAGKGGNFLLNIGPAGDGSVPAESMQRLAEVGAWMRVNGDSIKGTQASPFEVSPWGACTMRAMPNNVTRLYLHVFNWPADGVIRVPGLLNDVIGAKVLGGEPASKWSSGDGTEVVIHAQKNAANPHDTVIALDVKGVPDVGIAPSITSDAAIFVGKATVSLASLQKGVDIRYTTDGSEPTEKSAKGTSLTIEKTTTVTARSFRGQRAVSPSAKSVFTLATPAKAADGSHFTKDVEFAYYEGTFKTVAEMVAAKPVKKGKTQSLDLALRQRDSQFGFTFSGWIHVPADGVYRFFLGSDDGSTLSINNSLVVDNDTPHSFQERQGDVALAAGVHRFEVKFFENSGGFSLKADMQGPGLKRQPLVGGQ
jgi:alpha-L-fucosidase